MIKRVLLALAIFTGVSVFAQPTQTFAGTTGSIPDNNTWVTFPVTVSGLGQSVLNGTWGFDKLVINIQHTYDGDLQVHLVSASGVEVTVFDNVGGSGANFTNTNLKKNYTTPITQGSAPFTGNYKPTGDFGLFNNGSNGNGTWYLKIRDTGPADTGRVVSWNIRFSNAPATPPVPMSSNLPIVKIYTNGQTILDDPKVPVDFRIIDNGPGQRNWDTNTVYTYHQQVGIEYRGSSSGSAPKKSYGFETWDGNGNEVDTTLFGFPPQSDWILSASYYDKTLMRNVLSYKLFNDLGHYAVKTKYVELFVDDAYQGVYVAMEKIKRDKNRVDIAKLTAQDTTGDNLTGGYIVKVDKFTGSGGAGFYSNYPPSNPAGDVIYYQYEYPNQTDILQQQMAYIQRFVDSFEASLYGPNYQDPTIGFRHFAGEKTFIDYMLINEMSKNVDGYRLSTFFYKDKQSNGGKFKAGPVWDYDIAWMNADYCQAQIDTGWAYNLDYVCLGAAVPAHWERMMSDPLFKQRVYCRWTALRQTTLSFDSLYAFIDSTAAWLNEGQQRNFTTWPILGVATWPEPTPLPQTYAQEIQRLKSWITNRFIWLDAKISAFPHQNLPVALGNDTSFCSGQQITLQPTTSYDYYTWSNNTYLPTLTVNTSGAYSVTVADEFNCSGTDAINVNVQQVTGLNLGNDTAVCQGSSITLNAGNFNQYSWSNGASGAAISVSQTGGYAVTVTNQIGCTASDAVQVLVHNLPQAHLPADTGFCQGFSVVLNAGNATNYQWSNGSALNPLTISSPGLYQVTALDNIGCSATAVVQVSQYALPNASFSSTQQSLSVFLFEALNVNAVSYHWDFGDGSTSSLANVTHAFPLTGSYNVYLTVTDENGCQQTQSVLVHATSVGIHSLSADNFTVYPNPTTGVVIIDCKQLVPDQIVVRNLLGEELVRIYGVKESVTTLHAETFAAGIYFIEVKAGTKSGTSKFVKQ